MYIINGFSFGVQNHKYQYKYLSKKHGYFSNLIIMLFLGGKIHTRSDK
jgi:hypothetical protein